MLKSAQDLEAHMRHVELLGMVCSIPYLQRVRF